MANVVEYFSDGFWSSKLKLLESQYENTKSLVYKDTLTCHNWNSAIDLLLNEEKLYHKQKKVNELSRTVEEQHDEIQDLTRNLELEREGREGDKEGFSKTEEKLQQEVQTWKENHEEVTTEVKELQTQLSKMNAMAKDLKQNVELEKQEREKEKEEFSKNEKLFHREVKSWKENHQKAVAEVEQLKKQLSEMNVIEEELKRKLKSEKEVREKDKELLSKNDKKLCHEVDMWKENHQKAMTEVEQLKNQLKEMILVEEDLKSKLELEKEERKQEKEEFSKNKTKLCQEEKNWKDLKQKLESEKQERQKDKEEFSNNEKKLHQEVKSWKENHQKASTEIEELKMQLLEMNTVNKDLKRELELEKKERKKDEREMSKHEKEIGETVETTRESTAKDLEENLESQKEKRNTNKEKENEKQPEETKLQEEEIYPENHEVNDVPSCTQSPLKSLDTVPENDISSKAQEPVTKPADSTQVIQDFKPKRKRGQKRVLKDKNAGQPNKERELSKQRKEIGEAVETTRESAAKDAEDKLESQKEERNKGKEKEKQPEETKLQEEEIYPENHEVNDVPSCTESPLKSLDTVPENDISSRVQEPVTKPADSTQVIQDSKPKRKRGQKRVLKDKNAGQPNKERELSKQRKEIGEAVETTRESAAKDAEDKLESQKEERNKGKEKEKQPEETKLQEEEIYPENHEVNDVPSCTESPLKSLDTVPENDISSRVQEPVTKPADSTQVTKDFKPKRKRGQKRVLKDKNAGQPNNESLPAKAESSVYRPSFSIRQSSVSDMSSVLNGTKRRRTLYNSKMDNSLMISILPLQGSFMNSTDSRGKKANGTMPSSLNAFMKSFIAPKLKKSTQSQ